MSIRIMSEVWERDDLDKSETLVMLALADHADDEGRCYPSISRLCRRTRMGERTVQGVIKRLAGRGFVTVEMNAGKRGANVYTIRPTPAVAAPPQELPPAGIAPAPPQELRPTPAAAAPEPSRTIKEPSDIETPSEILAREAGAEAVSSFIAYRKRTKGKALTVTASKRLAASLKSIFEAGGDPDDALGMAEERGWLTVKPDWYFKERMNGNGTFGRSGPAGGRGGHPEAFDAVAVAARLGTTQG